jgi:hypothetical protein
MTTATRQTKACQIERTILVTVDDAFGRTVFATVFEKKHLKTKTVCTSDVYTLTRIPTQMGGVAVRVDKQLADGESYDVNISSALGDMCCCPAGTYRGECRHLAMCREAKRRGLI